MKGNGTLCQKLYTDWGKNIDTVSSAISLPYIMVARVSTGKMKPWVVMLLLKTIV